MFTHISALRRLKHILGQVYATHVQQYIPPGFRSHVFVMRVTGIWPTTADSSHYNWLTIGFFTSVAILYPLSLFVNIFYATSIPESMDYLFTSLTFWAVGIKASIIHWRCASIRRLFGIHVILSCSSAHSNSVARLNSRVHLLLTSLYCSGWSCFLTQVFYSDAEEGIWPSTSRLPYNVAKYRRGYLVVVMFQGIHNLISAIWVAMQDSFYTALMNSACGHLAELKERTHQLGMTHKAGADGDWRFYKELIECCKRYEDCLRFGMVMNQILSSSFFVQFGVSGVVFCCTAYLLSVSNPMEHPLKFIGVMSYSICVVAQILLNCYFGSRLSAESDSITNAIYESQWIDRNEKCKRAMRILVERSMRPMTIYAGGLFELSLPTFVNICRKAYTCFNLLHRMDSLS